jgi:hypothetical protein
MDKPWGWWRRTFHVHKWTKWEEPIWQSSMRVIGRQLRTCVRCGKVERGYVD